MSEVNAKPITRNDSIEDEDYHAIMDILLGDEFEENKFVLELVKHYPKVFLDVCDELGLVNNVYREIVSILGDVVFDSHYGVPTSNHKVAAIKRYRELTGSSLVEAKEYVEGVMNGLYRKNEA